MQLYSEHVSFRNIAEKVRLNFECYNLPDCQCTTRTVNSIITHKGWKVAQRMKDLLTTERASSIIGARQHACSKAQQMELDMLEQLHAEANGCLATLRGLDPAEKEYKNVVGSLKILNSEIERISGTGSVRKIQEFQAKEEIKAERVEDKRESDPRLIVPTIHTE